MRGRPPLDIERERDYRNAENGYNRTYGDRNRYRDTYRGGFARRLSRRLRPARCAVVSVLAGQRPRLGRHRQLRRVSERHRATATRRGSTTSTTGSRADVERQKWYRNGDHDYDSRYGSKETYRMEYRRGFEEGYNRAYGEARRY